MGHFPPCWGSLSRSDGHLRCDPVSSLSEQCGQCVQKRETHASGVNSLLSFHPPSLLLTFSIFSFFCRRKNLTPGFVSRFLVSFPHLSLPLSITSIFSSIPAASTVSIHSHLPYLPYMPSPSPSYTTPLPTYTPPHKNGYKSGGKFIRSKNKHVSVSVLLPCRVPQGCTALWMALSVRLVWGPCTHHRTHTLSKGHSKAVITSILQLCYCCYPPSSQSGLSPFLWVHSNENGAQNPAAIKCLLLLPNSSV